MKEAKGDRDKASIVTEKTKRDVVKDIKGGA